MSITFTFIVAAATPSGTLVRFRLLPGAVMLALTLLLAAAQPKPDLPTVRLIGGPPAVAAALTGVARVADADPVVVHWQPGRIAADELKTTAAALLAATPHVVFATDTPDDAATDTALSLGLPVHELFRVAPEHRAAAVADVVKRQLAVARPTRLKPPAVGPAAVAAYQKAEADRDAGVPAHFRTLAAPAFVPPKSADEWAARRPDVLSKVVASLGDLPPRPKSPKVRRVSAERRPGFRLEKLLLDNGVDGEMSALLLVPDGRTKPAPAVLWLHSSSFDHRQLLVPDTNGGAEPLGITFVKRGWVVFAPDAAWYGDRAGGGPSGPAETAAEQHVSQHKYHLWFGRTLWGMFVRDDQCALDYLCSRPEVDVSRIGATGISMGSTRSWWLAAVDERIACAVGVACLTRYENLLRHGQLRQHGVYYFVNGLLRHFDTEAVVALIAPRPVLFLTGELDAGSPADGIRVIEEKAAAVYAAAGAKEKFRSVRYPEVGHTYTPAMRGEMLKWFDVYLK